MLHFNLRRLSNVVSNSALAIYAPREYSFSKTAEGSILNSTEGDIGELVGDVSGTDLVGSFITLAGDLTELVGDFTELLGDFTELLGDFTELVGDIVVDVSKVDVHVGGYIKVTSD